MKFTHYLVAVVFLIRCTIAAPSKKSTISDQTSPGFGDRLGGERRVSFPQSRSARRAEAKDATKTVYDYNWAGAVYTAAPAGQTFTAVSASFTVPSPTATKGSDSGSFAIWVGIDGENYPGAILQTGIEASINKGVSSYNAWYEWYPDASYRFDLDLRAGDVIVASVDALSNAKGVAALKNLRSGQKVSKTLSAPSASATLRGQNAEWIIEDYYTNGIVPLASWGTVQFDGSVAKTDKATLDASGATILEMQQTANEVLSNTTVTGNRISIKYIGR